MICTQWRSNLWKECTFSQTKSSCRTFFWSHYVLGNVKIKVSKRNNKLTRKDQIQRRTGLHHKVCPIYSGKIAMRREKVIKKQTKINGEKGGSSEPSTPAPSPTMCAPEIPFMSDTCFTCINAHRVIPVCCNKYIEHSKLVIPELHCSFGSVAVILKKDFPVCYTCCIPGRIHVHTVSGLHMFERLYDVVTLSEMAQKALWELVKESKEKSWSNH